MKAIVRNLSLGLLLAAASTAGLGIVSTAAVAAAAEKAPKAPTISAAVAKPLMNAQKAIQDKKFDQALAILPEVESNAKKTPYDTFVMHQLRAYALTQLGRQDEAIPSYAAQVESGFLSPEDAARISRALVADAFQKKDYARTVESGQKVIASGAANEDIWYMVAAAHYLLDKPEESTRVLNDYFADNAKNGRKPSEPSLDLLYKSAAKTKNVDGMITALAKMVEFYPKPERWRDLLVTLRDARGGRGADSEEYTLNVYRLMRETGALTDSQEILEMGSLALNRGFPGEASDALKRGTAASAFKSDGDKKAAREIEQAAQASEKTDRASLVKIEAEAKGAKTGEADVQLGQAFLSYDQADKAVEALQRGIAKGSLKNADRAQILLGIAYLKLGRKPDAVTAFEGAKGGDPKLGELAKLWTIYAKS
jgi:tetratricopeptide (TPR) repeat protein